MVMGEVSLGRFEELFFGATSELRPTLTEGDPPMCIFEGSHGTAPSSSPVVDTFPDRCRWRNPLVRERESSFAEGFPLRSMEFSWQRGCGASRCRCCSRTCC